MAWAVNRIDDATARPPSWGVPMRPTMAVSASTYSGSATSAPRAGHASRQISVSSLVQRSRRDISARLRG